jgi:hypothetical protein
MNYTWDQRKNRRNIALHGLAFEDAVGIFDGPSLKESMSASITAKFASMLMELQAASKLRSFSRRIRAQNHLCMEGGTA